MGILAEACSSIYSRNFLDELDEFALLPPFALVISVFSVLCCLSVYEPTLAERRLA